MSACASGGGGFSRDIRLQSDRSPLSPLSPLSFSSLSLLSETLADPAFSRRLEVPLSRAHSLFSLSSLSPTLFSRLFLSLLPRRPSPTSPSAAASRCRYLTLTCLSRALSPPPPLSPFCSPSLSLSVCLAACPRDPRRPDSEPPLRIAALSLALSLALRSRALSLFLAHPVSYIPLSSPLRRPRRPRIQPARSPPPTHTHLAGKHGRRETGFAVCGVGQAI